MMGNNQDGIPAHLDVAGMQNCANGSKFRQSTAKRAMPPPRGTRSIELYCIYATATNYVIQPEPGGTPAALRETRACKPQRMTQAWADT